MSDDALALVALTCAPNLLAYLLLVRTATTCKAWFWAILASSSRLVEQINAQLPFAYMYGDYGPMHNRTEVGLKGTIDEQRRFKFHLSIPPKASNSRSLYISVGLHGHIHMPTAAAYGTLLTFNFALHFNFALCRTFGFPNGTVQAAAEVAAERKNISIQAQKPAQFRRNPDNQPTPLQIDFANSSIVVTSENATDADANTLTQYTFQLLPHRALEFVVMRSFEDFDDKTGFHGRRYELKQQLWFALDGIAHPKTIGSTVMRTLSKVDGKVVANPYEIPSFMRQQPLFFAHLPCFDMTPLANGHGCVCETFHFETAGEVDDKPSGKFIMDAFGYFNFVKERRRLKRKEARQQAREGANKSQKKREPRSCAKRAREEIVNQLNTFHKDERQDEAPNGEDLLPYKMRKVGNKAEAAETEESS